MRREEGLVICLPFSCQLVPKICNKKLESPLCGEIHEFSIALRPSTCKVKFFAHKIGWRKIFNFFLFIDEFFMCREAGLGMSLLFLCQLVHKKCNIVLISPLCGGRLECSLWLQPSTFKVEFFAQKISWRKIFNFFSFIHE